MSRPQHTLLRPGYPWRGCSEFTWTPALGPHLRTYRLSRFRKPEPQTHKKAAWSDTPPGGAKHTERRPVDVASPGDGPTGLPSLTTAPRGSPHLPLHHSPRYS